MNLATGESDKGWMGRLNNALRYQNDGKDAGPGY